jgi:orotate phosphoribosyltransferase-like protein
MLPCIKNSNTWDATEAPVHFSEFQSCNFDIGWQSIGTDSESETKEVLTDFTMKKNSFTAMLEKAV